jgi:hypothetical protein
MSTNQDLPFDPNNLDPLQDTVLTTSFSLVPIPQALEKNIGAPIQIVSFSDDQYSPTTYIPTLDAFGNPSAIFAANQASTHPGADSITGSSPNVLFPNPEGLSATNKFCLRAIEMASPKLLML